jgi:hypothetical protein
MLIQNFAHWKRRMLEGDKRCKDGVLERFLSIIRTYSASKFTALIKDPAAKSILFSIEKTLLTSKRTIQSESWTAIIKIIVLLLTVQQNRCPFNIHSKKIHLCRTHE